VGGAFHRSPDLVLATANTGLHPQTPKVSLETLCPTQSTEENADDENLRYSLPTEERVADRAPYTDMDWLNPLPTIEATRIRRHTDVSQDPRYSLHVPSASHYDAECTSAPSRIPAWVLPAEETQAHFEGGRGIAPELIYARGVPDTPDSCQTNFDKKTCTLVFIEIGFSQDLGCDKKHTEKTEKYSPSSRPSSSIGDGWNSSPSPSDTRVQR